MHQRRSSWQQPLYSDKKTFKCGSRLLQTPKESLPAGTGGRRAMGPGRQRAAIRLDATKCIFWNFRSPEKTCLFCLVMQAPRGIAEVRGCLLQLKVKQLRTGTDFPSAQHLLSEAYPPTISLVFHLLIQEPSNEQSCFGA